MRLCGSAGIFHVSHQDGVRPATAPGRALPAPATQKKKIVVARADARAAGRRGAPRTGGAHAPPALRQAVGAGGARARRRLLLQSEPRWEDDFPSRTAARLVKHDADGDEGGAGDDGGGDGGGVGEARTNGVAARRCECVEGCARWWRQGRRPYRLPCRAPALHTLDHAPHIDTARHLAVFRSDASRRKWLDSAPGTQGE